MTDMNADDVITLVFAKPSDTVAQEILFGKLIQNGLVQYTITDD